MKLYYLIMALLTGGLVGWALFEGTWMQLSMTLGLWIANQIGMAIEISEG
jgi:hypothetical protein